MRVEQNVKFDSKIYDVLIDMAMQAKRVRVIRVLLSVLGGAYIAFGLFYLIALKSFSPVFFVCGVFMLFFGLVYMPIIIRSNVRKMNAQTRGKKVFYACDENGIDVASEYGESHYEWSGVLWVRDLGEYIGINLVNRNTLLFIKEKLTEDQISWLLAKAPQ